MRTPLPRVAGVLIGDIERQDGARVKYGGLFEALGDRLPLVAVHDASLVGARRLLTALRTFRPDRRRWRELFHKDPAAFRARSRRAQRLIGDRGRQADVVLQLGGMLDSRWRQSSPPSVIYTDYTARLSARRKSAGRSPFSERRLGEWLRLETRTYRRAAHVCTRSEYVRDSLIADYDLPPERVTAIGGGVNFPTLPALTAVANGSPTTALFVGVELHRKGGDMLLKAFARARAVVPEARLLLVTGDPIPEELPLDGVTVLAPTWDRDRLHEYYDSAGLFVLPSRLETWGDVLLEAMAHGLPCIGTDGEAMAEIIAAGRTGLLVPADNEERLADALVELFRDPERRARYGLAGRQRVEAKFTWALVAERLAPILEAAATARGAK